MHMNLREFMSNNKEEEQRWLQPLASSKSCGSDTSRMRQQRMGERCQQRNGTTLRTSHTLHCQPPAYH
ncbi:hypothetical protein Aduo_005424 [Ancylostoma duodenale]